MSLDIIYPQNLVSFLWFFNKKWYFDYLYNYYIGYNILRQSYSTFYKIIDKGILEIFGFQGLSFMVYKIAIIFSKKQSGYLYHSGCLLLLWLLVLLYLGLIF